MIAKYLQSNKISANDTSFTEAKELELTPTNEDFPPNDELCGNFDKTSVTSVGEFGNAGPGHLGKLHSTVRYCFEKNALIVTINMCENLPAKDTAAKSR